VIDLSLSLDEEDSFNDISHDFEFAQWLYGELNRDPLVPSGDDKIIILSDSDEEKEEAHEEKSAGAKDAVVSAAVNPVSTTSADDAGTLAEKSSTLATSPADADEDPRAVPNDSSDGLALGPKMGEDSGGGDEADTPYAAAPRTAFEVGVLQRELHSALQPFFLLCVEELGW
jgi:hypothetical protein